MTEKSEVVFPVQHSQYVCLGNGWPRIWSAKDNFGLLMLSLNSLNSVTFHSEKCPRLDNNDHLTKKTVSGHMNSYAALLWTCSIPTHVVNLEKWNLLFWSRNLKAKYPLSSCVTTVVLYTTWKILHCQVKQVWLLSEHMVSQRFNAGACHEFPRGSYTRQFSQTYLNIKSFLMKCQKRSAFHKMLPHFCWTNVGVLDPGESAANKTEYVSSRAFTLVRQTGNKPVNRPIKCGKRWSIPQANDRQNKTCNSEEYSWSSNPSLRQELAMIHVCHKPSMGLTSPEWAGDISLNKPLLLELAGLHWAFWLVCLCLLGESVSLCLLFVDYIPHLCF